VVGEHDTAVVVPLRLIVIVLLVPELLA